MKIKTKVLAIIAISLWVFIPKGVALDDVSYVHEEPPRAMWVWDVKIAVSGSETRGLIDFCKSNNIELLYLSAFSFTGERPQAYKSFNTLAHKNGIKVHALAGDPRWCIEKYHKQPIEWVKKIIEFNKSSKPEERFDGIQSDAEPYVLGKVWENKKEMLLKWYLDLNQKIVDLIDTEEAQIIYGAAIPFWYDDDASMQVEWHGTVKPPSFHVLDTTDTVAVMDYRNFAEGPNGSITLARFEVEYAGEVGKKIYIGQETKKDVYPEYVSFGTLDVNIMEKEINKLTQAYIGHPGFAGIAIHHYRSYKKLLEKKK